MAKFVGTGFVVAALGALLAMGQGLAQPATAPPAPGAPPPQTGAPVPTSPSSKIGFFESDPALGASYPRVIQLKNFAGGKGVLLATFARRGAMPIYRSTDNGETWSFYSEVPNLRGQPCLYELPQKMGEFPAGTIMAAGTGAPGADPTRRTLELSVSSDGARAGNISAPMPWAGRDAMTPPTGPASR